MSTPMLDQYHRLRAEAPQAILFYRLGDFYEIFGADAERAAPLLDVQLTSRDGKIPMCGVPHHALNTYAKRLLDCGHMVAIAEQMEDPRLTKGLVDRQITRILTPGTFIPDDAAEVPRFAVLVTDRQGWALVVAELSTGTVHVVDLASRDAGLLRDEWERWTPQEYLANAAETLDLSGVRVQTGNWFQVSDPTALEKRVAERLGSVTLDSWGLSGKPRAKLALMVLWRYLESSQRQLPAHLTHIRVHAPEHSMRVSSRTLHQLDAIRPAGPSLWHHLDHTTTPMGSRLLRSWIERPLTDLAQIEARNRAVSWLISHPGPRHDLRALLRAVGDLSRRVARITMGVGSPRDLSGVAGALAQVPAVAEIVAEGDWWSGPPLATAAVTPVADVLAALAEPAPARWDDGNLIRGGFDPELDEACALRDHQRENLTALEAQEREHSRLKSLKVGYHRSFGYYWEVNRSQAADVPAEWQRRQTMTNSERFTSPALRALETRIAQAEEAIRTREAWWADRLVSAVRERAADLGRLAAQLAEADVVAGLAEVAEAHRYHPPVWDTSDQPSIVAEHLRHPILDALVADYVPSGLQLGPQTRLAVVTGPNMGGKSTFMRALALNVIMAHMGSMVAATHFSLPILDGVFTRIGADDDMFRGQSTFMVEMEEVAGIVKQVTPQSLVLLDELGRGTSTYDGLAIARAVAERLAGPGAPWTLFATHYHELTELAEQSPRVTNLHVEVADDGPGHLVFTHRVLPGAASRSYGLDVAKMAGLPYPVLTRARHFLKAWEPRPPASPGRAAEQVTLFSADPVLEELRDGLAGLDPDSLSPRDAWQWLASWHDRLRAR
ncbi:MAG: DNA mismatch repair protein MutS [Thermaerobacter sp.]|nr:DNA mismatch repair protein MutS [Thermaerobacter sp.]